MSASRPADGPIEVVRLGRDRGPSRPWRRRCPGRGSPAQGSRPAIPARVTFALPMYAAMASEESTLRCAHGASSWRRRRRGERCRPPSRMTRSSPPSAEPACVDRVGQEDLEGHAPGGRRGEGVGQEGDRDLVDERSGEAQRPSRSDRQLDERLAGGASEARREGCPAGERGDQLPWLHARDGAAAHDPRGAEVAGPLDAVADRSPAGCAGRRRGRGRSRAARGEPPVRMSARSRAAPRGSGASTSTPPTSSASSTVRRPGRGSRAPRTGWTCRGTG